jgi:hypothetical protein
MRTRNDQFPQPEHAEPVVVLRASTRIVSVLTSTDTTDTSAIDGNSNSSSRPVAVSVSVRPLSVPAGRIAGMSPLLLTDIERAVRSSWSAETSTPEFRSRWTEDNPARDQCGVTAMVLNDLLGGELIRGEVHVNGERVDYHWWNRLGMGIEIDLTREQFGPEEIVTGGLMIPRPPMTEWRRLRQEYELLRDRVLEKLNRQ